MPFPLAGTAQRCKGRADGVGLPGRAASFSKASPSGAGLRSDSVAVPPVSSSRGMYRLRSWGKGAFRIIGKVSEAPIGVWLALALTGNYAKG
jgi:hypothetical protein